MPTVINSITMFWPFILLAILIYVFMYLPQKRQRARYQEMLTQLEPGKQIVTKSGTCATIESITQDTLIIKLHGGTTSEILKEAVLYFKPEQK